MGDQEANQNFQDLELKEIEANGAQQIHWVSTESSIEYSTSSVESLSSSDLVEDASSPTSSSPSNGPLYELSELMAQLPIKRGFSRYYQGKSQSFTSLANVKSIEDLVKKRPAYRRKMKSCKSYTESLDNGNKIFTPKATISKKASRGYFFSSLGKSGTLVGSCRPLIHVQKHF